MQKLYNLVKVSALLLLLLIQNSLQAQNACLDCQADVKVITDKQVLLEKIELKEGTSTKINTNIYVSYRSGNTQKFWANLAIATAGVAVSTQLQRNSSVEGNNSNGISPLIPLGVSVATIPSIWKNRPRGVPQAGLWLQHRDTRGRLTDTWEQPLGSEAKNSGELLSVNIDKPLAAGTVEVYLQNGSKNPVYYWGYEAIKSIDKSRAMPPKIPTVSFGLGCPSDYFLSNGQGRCCNPYTGNCIDEPSGNPTPPPTPTPTPVPQGCPSDYFLSNGQGRCCSPYTGECIDEPRGPAVNSIPEPDPNTGETGGGGTNNNPNGPPPIPGLGTNSGSSNLPGVTVPGPGTGSGTGSIGGNFGGNGGTISGITGIGTGYGNTNGGNNSNNGGCVNGRNQNGNPCGDPICGTNGFDQYGKACGQSICNNGHDQYGTPCGEPICGSNQLESTNSGQARIAVFIDQYGNECSRIDDVLATPCFKNTLSKLKNSNIKGTIAKIFQDYNKSKNNNFTLREEVLTGVYAQYLAHTDGSLITLNTGILKDASQELIGLSIIHEMLHVYINKDELTDHIKTSEKYVKPMADYINKIFGVDIEVAKSLVWSGLQDTPAWGQLSEQAQYQAINNLRLHTNLNNFNHGQIGTHCLD